ncbi:reverse transcriptase domain-containing protein [Tanacetum coccineum]
MDDEPMWAADSVVAPTLGSAIIIPETANEFAIKDTKNEAVRLMMFPLSLTGEANTWLDELNEGTIEMWYELRTAFISRFFPPALFDQILREIRAFSQHENESLIDAWLRMKEMLRNYHGHNLSKAYQLLEDKVLLKLDWAKNQKTKSSLKKTVAFADEAKQPTPDLDDDDMPMYREEEAKSDLGASINLMPYSLYAKLSLKTLKPTKMSVRLADISFQYPVGIAENMLVEVVIRVKQKQLNLGVGTERMIFNIDSAMKHSYSNDDTRFSIDVIGEILEEDFDANLDEGSKILHSIEGTLLEEEIFSEFDEFRAMATDENFESKSDTEEPPFEQWLPVLLCFVELALDGVAEMKKDAKVCERDVDSSATRQHAQVVRRVMDYGVCTGGRLCDVLCELDELVSRVLGGVLQRRSYRNVDSFAAVHLGTRRINSRYAQKLKAEELIGRWLSHTSLVEAEKRVGDLC